MGTKLTIIAVDLETTGFAISDHITVVGFVLPLGCRVFYNTDSRKTPQGLEQTIRDRVKTHVDLTAHSTEEELLEAVITFAHERLSDNDNYLVAFNGERFRGGFDLPFLRSRSVKRDVEWAFNDLAYADLQPIIEARFNTTVPTSEEPETGEEVTDLCGAYDALLGDGLGELDPFEESSGAVAAFADGDFESLIMHNIADILRTQALAELAEQYCATSDFQMKSLTPPTSDSHLE